MAVAAGVVRDVGNAGPSLLDALTAERQGREEPSHAGQEIEGGTAGIPVLKGIQRMNLAAGLSGVASPARYRTVSNNSALRPPAEVPQGPAQP